MSTPILTSLHGHKVGLDANGNLTLAANTTSVGPSPGFVEGVNAMTTSSTGITIPAGGLTTISGGSAAYSMAAPVPGLGKALQSISTSTDVIRKVTLASGNFLTSGGSTFTTLNFNGAVSLALEGISTALFSVLSALSSSTGNSVYGSTG